MTNRPDHRNIDVPTLWCGRVNLIPESVKLLKVAIGSSPLQPCALAQCALTQDAELDSANSLRINGSQTSLIFKCLQFPDFFQLTDKCLRLVDVLCDYLEK